VVNAVPAIAPSNAPAPDAVARAWSVLATVPDPEIPVLSLVDLGIVRSVEVDGAGSVEVGLALTYSGCPATTVIHESVATALRAAGFANVSTLQVLSPPWTSDWISADGRSKLAHYGIAPPVQSVSSPRGLGRAPAAIRCPRCGSTETRELSAFGSTPCKALHSCTACLEPFEYFKCI
jgi:ring-1,2-phenylacetyl-CoA epoxidase subunit PaaD